MGSNGAVLQPVTAVFTRAMPVLFLRQTILYVCLPLVLQAGLPGGLVGPSLPYWRQGPELDSQWDSSFATLR